MKQCMPFRYPGTAEDVARLSSRLRDAFSAVGFPNNRVVSVLNLACGRADETGALASALAPARIEAYLGIDLRPEAIAEAAKRWKLPGGFIEFRCGDASSIDRLGVGSGFDLIFIRHQNYWADPPVWDRLLENALKVLKPEGLIVCTSYFDREHELMIAALKTRGAEVLWNSRDLDSRALSDAPGKSVDRHLAMFRLGAQTFESGANVLMQADRVLYGKFA
jgi:SAM-dependent methyltransferase